MKKLFAVIVSAALICLTAACSNESASEVKPTDSAVTTVADKNEAMDEVLKNNHFKGIVTLLCFCISGDAFCRCVRSGVRLWG